jgi:hypothetical protein
VHRGRPRSRTKRVEQRAIGQELRRHPPHHALEHKRDLHFARAALPQRGLQRRGAERAAQRGKALKRDLLQAGALVCRQAHQVRLLLLLLLPWLLLAFSRCGIFATATAAAPHAGKAAAARHGA